MSVPGICYFCGRAIDPEMLECVCEYSLIWPAWKSLSATRISVPVSEEDQPKRDGEHWICRLDDIQYGWLTTAGTVMHLCKHAPHRPGDVVGIREEPDSELEGDEFVICYDEFPTEMCSPEVSFVDLVWVLEHGALAIVGGPTVTIPAPEDMT